MRLWSGFILLAGSLVLALLLALAATYLLPLALLLLLPAGGLLAGTGLIVTGPQPRWAKLLALSPILRPLLLVLAQYGLPPTPNHLVFLLPVGFRGSVTLSHDPTDYFSERVAGHLLIEVPDKQFVSSLTVREQLVATDLAEADYYVVDAQGHRLRQLPRLAASAFARPAQRTAAPAPLDPRQVGVFGTEADQQLPAPGPRSLQTYVRRLWNNPYDKVEQLTFTVACYDSLQLQRIVRPHQPRPVLPAITADFIYQTQTFLPIQLL